jgi:NAD(P)-dependent dehydrogenase (short-subunit alcohol dehydrogenase family)
MTDKTLVGKSAIVTGSTSGIGLGIATAFAAGGANVMLNGFGDAQQIESLHAGLAKTHDVKVSYSAAGYEQASGNRRHVREGARRIRRSRHPGEQCRDTACGASGGISHREMRRNHRHQPLVRL